MTKPGWLIVVGVVLAGACGGDSSLPGDPVEPGNLTLMLSTPATDDVAVILTVDGQLESFTPAAGVTAFTDLSSVPASIVMVSGARLSQGANVVGVARVRDVDQGRTARVSVQEVATENYSVRASLQGYSASLQ